MQASTINKCREVQAMLSNGVPIGKAIKKVGISYGSFDTYRKKTVKAKVNMLMEQSPTPEKKSNPIIFSILKSNLSPADKIELCAGLL